LRNELKHLLCVAVACIPLQVTAKPPVQEKVLATNYIVSDLDTGEIIAEKDTNEVRSIASITKLMTAIVVLDAGQDLNEKIKITKTPGVSTRLPLNSQIPRSELILLALMSSDNGAAKLLAENYPGGESSAITAMNFKAQLLGMNHTRFVDSTGLLPDNVSNLEDLLKLTLAAHNYEIIRNYSTRSHDQIVINNKNKIDFKTTNSLVSKIDVSLSKTGWIRASGGCLLMVVYSQGKRLAIILLNSRNTQTRIRDGFLLMEYNNARNYRNLRSIHSTSSGFN